MYAHTPTAINLPLFSGLRLKASFVKSARHSSVMPAAHMAVPMISCGCNAGEPCVDPFTMSTGSALMAHHKACVVMRVCERGGSRVSM